MPWLVVVSTGLYPVKHPYLSDSWAFSHLVWCLHDLIYGAGTEYQQVRRTHRVHRDLGQESAHDGYVDSVPF